jgi:hypothetical protein
VEARRRVDDGALAIVAFEALEEEPQIVSAASKADHMTVPA